VYIVVKQTAGPTDILCVVVLIIWRLNRDCEFGTGYVLSTVKVQLTVELV